MNRIYHGCMLKNADGSNRITRENEKGLVPTAKCFWKCPEDIEHRGAIVRSQSKKLETVSREEFDQYE